MTPGSYLILSGAGVVPTFPPEGVTLKEDLLFDPAINLFPGEWAYNKTDRLYYYATSTEILPITDNNGYIDPTSSNHDHDDRYSLLNHLHDERYLKLSDYVPGTSGDPGGVVDLNGWFELMNEGLPNEYLRLKKALAGDFEIQAWSALGQIPPSIWESMPIVTSGSGNIGAIQLFDPNDTTHFLRGDGSWVEVVSGGGGVNMIYPPSSGIPTVDAGNAWGGTIEDNSTYWNTAYNWGDHSAMNYATLNDPSFTGSVVIENILSTNYDKIRLEYDNEMYGVGIASSSTGGWSRRFGFFKANDASLLGGFGGFGQANSLSYLFAGREYDDASAIFYLDGAAELNYNGAKKLETNASGIIVTGNIIVTGEVSAYDASDRQFKTNILPFIATDILDRLNPVTYQWNDLARALNPSKNDERQFGLIAQELEEVLPELIHPIYGEYKSVNYIQLIPIMIQAIKELKKDIKLLNN